MVFGSAFPAAQDALFRAHAEAGLRLVSGRGIQTVGPTPPRPAADRRGRRRSSWSPTRSNAGTAVDTGDPAHGAAAGRDRAALLPVGHAAGRCAALGELYDERPRPRRLRPHATSTRTTDPATARSPRCGRCTRSTATSTPTTAASCRARGRRLEPARAPHVLAHAVHCTDAELARLAETQTSIAHCPTSQQFLGSGTMPWRRTIDAGVNVALGSDVGARRRVADLSACSNDAYKVHLSEPGADARGPAPGRAALHRHAGRRPGARHGGALRQLRRGQGRGLRPRRRSRAPPRWPAGSRPGRGRRTRPRPTSRCSSRC